MVRRYEGWSIHDRGVGSHPITGRWQAHRWGVWLGTTTQEGLIRMIDRRNSEERKRYRESREVY